MIAPGVTAEKAARCGLRRVYPAPQSASSSAGSQARALMMQVYLFTMSGAIVEFARSGSNEKGDHNVTLLTQRLSILLVRVCS